MSKRSLIDLAERHCAERGLPLGRERVLALIFCGDVLINGERCREAKRNFPETAQVEIRNLAKQAAAAGSPVQVVSAGIAAVPPPPFVSRGGDKLDSVLEAWRVPVGGRIWLDAGCSTGGFSHCLLLRGAALVHAVDVGYNQLDWRLRNHPTVQVHERTNIMGLESLDPQPEAAVADLSFRSMEGAARRILALCSGNELYALIKPQFERKYFLAGQADAVEVEMEAAEDGFFETGDFLDDDEGAEIDEADQVAPASRMAFSGVVSPGETRSILEDLARRLAAEGIVVERIARAGLKGRTGNQEYIALLRQSSAGDKSLRAQGFAAIASLF